MPSCYILHSRKLNKYYVGASKGSAEERLRTHLAREFGTKAFTASVDDWVVVLEMSTDTYQMALRIEKKIKVQ
ncbi:MAG: GIY-YIG nuclease family protein [Bacteroidetes bacterium]|nr:MAG: GIY-YIG nuclease family protein [Bacteroidota bacterium]